MSIEAKKTRWDRPRLLIVIYVDVICTIAAMVFARWTGLAALWIGYRIREYLPPELAHRAFLRTVRWTYWQPAMTRMQCLKDKE